MSDKPSTPVCARCGHDRITYKDMEGRPHIVLPFAIPADAPLDNRSIERYVAAFAAEITMNLDRIRKERGQGSNILIIRP